MNEIQTDNDDKIFDDKIFKDHLRNKLIQLFDTIPGNKDLIVEKCVVGPINISIDYPTLKEQGINRICTLDTDEIQTDMKTIVFFVTPKVSLMKMIANIILTHQKSNQLIQYFLIFWPKRDILCKEALENYGVYATVTIKDFSFDLIPLENDLLSLQMDHTLKNYYLGHDLQILQYVGESIERLQTVYGMAQNIYAKGLGAKIVVDILKQKQTRDYDEQKQDIESLIIFDRSIDFITPLLTQQTYQGLIDEIYAIKNNQIQIDPQILEKQGDQPITVSLNSNIDVIYRQSRDYNFSVCRNFLVEKVAMCQEIKNEKNNDMTVQEMQQYMLKFKAVQKEFAQVGNNVNLADSISNHMKTLYFINNLRIEQGIVIGAKTSQSLDHIEMSCALQDPLNKVLRLLALQSQVDNGIKQKQLDYLKREIIQCYGFHNILLLNNLEKVGIIKKQDTKSNWDQLRDKLRLVNEDVDAKQPNDCAYAYSGFAPICCRLVENILQKKSWKNITDLIKLIPGPQFMNEQSNKGETKQKIILVYMIGGITFGEVAAFRFLAKQFNKEIIICTTQIINGDTLIDSFKAF